MGGICNSCFRGADSDDVDGGRSDERDRLLRDPTEVPADRSSLHGDDAGYLSGGGIGGGRLTRDYGTTNGGSSNGAYGYPGGGLNSSNSGVGLHRQESSAWNRILEKMANDVIDVSTIGGQSGVLEQSEWMERSRLYAHRVAGSRVNSILKATARPPSLPRNDVKMAIERSLQPIPDTDLDLIREFSQASVDAVRTGFVIHIDEPLIVEFNP